MRNLIGEQIVDCKENILGFVTDQYHEDGRDFAVINGDYEVDLSGCAEILDVFGVARSKNTALKPNFIKLAN